MWCTILFRRKLCFLLFQMRCRTELLCGDSLKKLVSLLPLFQNTDANLPPPLNSLPPHSDTLFSISSSTRWLISKWKSLHRPSPSLTVLSGGRSESTGREGWSKCKRQEDKGKCENDTWKCHTTKDGTSCDRWNFTNHLLL